MINPLNFPTLILVFSFLLLWFAAWAGGKVSQRRHDLSEEMRPDFSVILAASLTLLGLCARQRRTTARVAALLTAISREFVTTSICWQAGGSVWAAR